MDHFREVLRYYYYAYRTVLQLLDITVYKILWRQNTSVYISFVEKTFPEVCGLRSRLDLKLRRAGRLK